MQKFKNKLIVNKINQHIKLKEEILMQLIEKSIKVISEQLHTIMDEQMGKIVVVDNELNRIKAMVYSPKTSAKEKDESLDKYIELLKERDGLFAPFNDVYESLYRTGEMLNKLKWNKLRRFHEKREVAKMEKHIGGFADDILTQVSEQQNIQDIQGIGEAIRAIQEEKEAKKEKVGK